MNTWRARISVAVLFLAMQQLHAIATVLLQNTPASMLVYHGSAALVDWLLVLVIPCLLVGKLCRHMQWLLVASIVINALGWMFYMSYAPPSFYNGLFWWLSCAQWLRLFIPDGHDARNSRGDMVHNRHYIGHFFRIEKEYQ